MNGIMAKLREYEQTSSKNGYHLKGWTKSSGNTTLQVRYPCELLFDWLGFDEGDRIPSDLVTSLISANLLFTIGDGTNEIQNTEWAPSLESVSEELTVAQRKRLLGFVREYDGPQTKFVRDLCSDIDTGEDIPDESLLSGNTSPKENLNWQACLDDGSRGADSSLHQIADDIFGSTLSETASSALTDWGIEDPDAFTDISHVESSIILFRNYPGTVHDVIPEEDYIQYVVSLPEESPAKSWPSPDKIDSDDLWPRYIVSHRGLIEGTEIDIKIDILVPNVRSSSINIDVDGLLHKLLVDDTEIYAWLVKPWDDSKSDTEDITESDYPDWRERLKPHLDDVADNSRMLLDYLRGEPSTDRQSSISVGFGEL